MRLVKAILAAAVAVFLPCTAAWSAGTLSLQARLDSYLRPYAAAGEFSGVALIADSHGVLAHAILGYSDFRLQSPNTMSTRFRIASLSKTFTAAAIAILAKQGKLKLDQPLSDFLPDFPNAKSIKIEHLLAHSSGVGSLDDPRYVLSETPLATLVAEIGRQPVLFPPGTKGQYSNEGYILLAAVIEKVSGKSYAQFLQDAIFGPLNLRSTGITLKNWTVDGHASGYLARDGAGGVTPAATQVTWPGPGALHASAADLLSWLKALNASTLFDVMGQAYPYGWGKRTYEGSNLIEQSGEIEGYVSYIAYYPKEGYRVVVLSNIESGLLNRVGPDIGKILAGRTPSAPPAVAPQAVTADQGAAFAGVYHTPAIPVPARINLRDGLLVQSWGDSPFSHPLVVIGADRAFGPLDFLTITLDRTPEGVVKGADWSWDGSPPLPMTR